MSFENPTLQTCPLYKERSSANIDDPIEELRRIESGAVNKIELNDAEKESFLKFEDALGCELEKIFKISIISSTIYPEYFLTEKGKEDFRKITGKDLTADNIDSIVRCFYEYRKMLEGIPSKERSNLFSRSRDFSDEMLLSKMTEKMDEEGNFNLEGITIPARMNVLLSTDKALEKINGLRELKKKIKDYIKDVDIQSSQVQESDNLKKVKLIALDPYKRRVNEMIANLFYTGVMAHKTGEIIGDQNLSENEKKLIKEFVGLGEFKKNYSRYDKFIHGASKEYKSGFREQISQEIVNYADALEKEYVQNEIEKPRNIKEKGLDYDKIFKDNIEKSEFCKIGEDVLDHYSQKSAQSSEDYFIEREGPAPDNKWQFVARNEFRSMGVDSKQKAVKSGVKNKSIQEVIAVLIGHEIEGHFVQALNESQIPLRLMKEVGGDRTSIISEGGAMMIQDRITREAFGYKTIPHPYYVRAMIKKLEGGNYLDCIKAFYDSSRKGLLKKKKLGLINEEKFTEELKENLKLAINRTKRLYKEGVDYDDGSKFLAKSKDTAYLEQLILLQKLKDKGMEKYAYIGGCNLNTLILLSKIGFLDLNKIEKPKFYALKVWDKIKNNYKLEGSN